MYPLMSLACFGADNDHITLPNNIRGKENTYSFFSSIELQFVIIFYHMQANKLFNFNSS